MIIKFNKNLRKPFANEKFFIIKSFADIFTDFFAKSFFIDVIKNNFTAILSFIEFFIKYSKVNLNLNIKTDYDFRN